MKLTWIQRILIAVTLMSVIGGDVSQVESGGSATTPDTKIGIGGGKFLDVTATAGPGNDPLPNLNFSNPFKAFGTIMTLAEEIDVDYTEVMAGTPVSIPVGAFSNHGVRDEVKLNVKLA